jgi:hypothetical protein
MSTDKHRFFNKYFCLYLCSSVIVLLTSTLIKAQSVAGAGEQGRTWAVVVGISRYPKLPGGQQLQFAERDAADFAQALTRTGTASDRVRLLIGQQATSSSIKAMIGNWLARSASESDTVYLFFSGHGFVEREFKDAYLLGYDSDLKDPYATGISLSELSHALSKRVRARRVLIIADAIRRDLFPDDDPSGHTVFFESINRLAATRPGVSAFLANGPGEFSREGQRWGGRGVFTKHLLDGLSGSADRDGDQSVTASEAFEYTSSRVYEDTSSKQKPWLSDSSDAALAEFIISRPAAIAQSETSVRQPRASDPQKARSENISRPAPEAARPSPARAAGSEPPVTGEVSPSNRDAPAVAARPLPSNSTSGPPPKPVNPPPKLPETAPVATNNPAPSSTDPAPGARVSTGTLESPPRPAPAPPSLSTVSTGPARGSTESIRTTIPSSQPGAAPSPLALQVEAAIASGSLIGPGEANAWDLFQRLTRDQPSSEIVRDLKPRLGAALLSSGRAIVLGDVRSDNISDKVEDFKRAGQLIARARSLMPDNNEAQALEKLCASAALIALQFFDEAERSLSQIQGARLAAVENALGIIYRGKFDDYRAERAFKRSIDLDPKWAAPHYNLALLYKSQKREPIIDLLSRACELDPSNPTLHTTLGDEHFERQQWQQAVDAYQKAVSLRPDDDAMHTKLGHALYSGGRRDEANIEYQKAADLRKRRP